MSPTRRDDALTSLLGEFAGRLRGDRWEPDLDAFETEGAFVVRVELAGVRSEELRVTVAGEELCIRGERRPPAPAGVRRLHRMEIASGPFERRVRVPIPFDRDAVSAHLADGFLTVTLPKRAPTRRVVQIEKETEESA